MALGLVAAASLLSAQPVRAQGAYPERNITLIVPFLAGGGADITARQLARAMEKHMPLAARITVVSRPGAAGEIGMAAVATAKPDGYTIGLTTTPNIVAIPIERSAQFTLDTIDALANVVDDPGTLSVHADSPIKTIADLIAASRKDKEKDGLTVGTAGVGSAGHIALTMLMNMSEFRGRNVPYSGSAGVRTALLTRDIQVGFANLGEALTYSKGNPWRILAQMAPQRLSIAPDIPTFRELGIPIETGSLRLVIAPRGMPKDVVAYLETTIEKAVQDPEFLATAKSTDLPVRYMGRDEINRFLRAMDVRLRELWKVAPWNK
ncbi:MAG: tripartite tricarboxylate transporter substrate binding protein [Proteobacteria bacterium]|nr:tripartite tricarboxylate transporter substrate binding protein [Burkholderiales bacterium]